MVTRSRRLARVTLVTLTLGILVAGLALAQSPPQTTEATPEIACAVAAPGAASPDLGATDLLIPEPTLKTCLFGSYDEWLFNGEVCCTRNTCLPYGQQYQGTCPCTWNSKTTEVIVCHC